MNWKCCIHVHDRIHQSFILQVLNHLNRPSLKCYKKCWSWKCHNFIVKLISSYHKFVCKLFLHAIKDKRNLYLQGILPQLAELSFFFFLGTFHVVTPNYVTKDFIGQFFPLNNVQTFWLVIIRNPSAQLNKLEKPLFQEKIIVMDNSMDKFMDMSVKKFLVGYFNKKTPN